jgi:hypothetical protein
MRAKSYINYLNLILAVSFIHTKTHISCLNLILAANMNLILA